MTGSQNVISPVSQQLENIDRAHAVLRVRSDVGFAMVRTYETGGH
jgi:hypothetical protein